MLRELRVKNLAVVADATVELGPGLNALTGETGAGKSLIVDSLALLAGGRASAEAIRSDAETLQVVGLFEPAGQGWKQVLEAAGLEAEGSELLVRREVSRAGKNRVFLNDQPATVRLLADLAPELLRIHGQRDELGLVAPDLQRSWLDASGGAKAASLVGEVGKAYRRYSEIAHRLARATGDERSRRERQELLTYQAREIDALNLAVGEERSLAEERELLRHSEVLSQALGGALGELVEEEGAASARLARARSALAGIEAWEARSAGWQSELEEARIRAEEVARELRDRLARIEADPSRLDQVEERLAQVERLCRRYGGSTEEVLALRKRIEEELAELSGEGASHEELAAALRDALADYGERARELSRRRREWGERLARKIETELAELGLAKARLAIELERRSRPGSGLEVEGQEVEPGPEGYDQVVFLLAPNPGEPLAPLARIASGGELSRLYLALQLAVGAERQGLVPTLIFDEVDTGVGGAQAAALGEKLQRLAGRNQIVVVTHLPQVASFGDHHLRIQKVEKGGRTFTSVAVLDAGARVEELARMLAGSQITELSRSHAREMLEGAARRP